MSNIYKQPDFIELRNKVPKVKCSVLICDNHRCTNYNDINTTIINDESTSANNNWLLYLKCKVCNNEWSICTICSQFKKKLTNNRMINLHRASYHGDKNNKRKHDQLQIHHTNVQQPIIEAVAEIVNNNSSVDDIAIEVIDDTREVVDDNVNIDNDKNIEDKLDSVDDIVHKVNDATTIDVDSIRQRFNSCQKTTMYLNNPTHQIYYEDIILKKENIHCLSEKTKSVRYTLCIFIEINEQH
jgi:hypothetical protein